MLSLTGALHRCVYDRTTAYYPEEGHSKVKTTRKATKNHLFSLDTKPIDGCFEDVLQQWLLFFDVSCRLPPAIDGCFEDALQLRQWPLFFVVDCRLSSDGSHRPAVNSRTPEEEDGNVM